MGCALAACSSEAPAPVEVDLLLRGADTHLDLTAEKSLRFELVNACDDPKATLDGTRFRTFDFDRDARFLRVSPPIVRSLVFGDDVSAEPCGRTREAKLVVDCEGGSPGPGLVYGSARAERTLTLQSWAALDGLAFSASGTDVSPLALLALDFPVAVRLDASAIALSGSEFTLEQRDLRWVVHPVDVLDPSTEFVLTLDAGEQGLRAASGLCAAFHDGLPRTFRFRTRDAMEPGFRAQVVVNGAGRSLAWEAIDVDHYEVVVAPDLRPSEQSRFPWPGFSITLDTLTETSRVTILGVDKHTQVVARSETFVVDPP